MCGSTVDIQSETAEHRQEKKIQQELTTGQKYNVCICYAGRPVIQIQLYALHSIINTPSIVSSIKNAQQQPFYVKVTSVSGQRMLASTPVKK